MHILVIPGSNSHNSINKKLAIYAAGLFKQSDLTMIDLNDFEMPIFSVDKEYISGPQPLAKQFLDHIAVADFIVLSLAEHNGSYSAAFKNIMDWASRINGKMWQEKPMLIMATSPGARGGTSVLEAALKRFPFMGAEILGSFSLPSFNQNFDIDANTIRDTDLNDQLISLIGDITVQLRNRLILT